jgi:hypothetical protein
MSGKPWRPVLNGIAATVKTQYCDLVVTSEVCQYRFDFLLDLLPAVDTTGISAQPISRESVKRSRSWTIKH